jgi:hypothetical protein
MPCNVLYLGKSSMWVWEKCVFHIVTLPLLDDVFCKCSFEHQVELFNYILTAFCLLNLSITGTGALKFPTIIVNLPVFLYMPIRFCFIYLMLCCVHINYELLFCPHLFLLMLFLFADQSFWHTISFSLKNFYHF